MKHKILFVPVLMFGIFYLSNEVLAIEDNSAPQVTAFSITPTSFNTESSDQTLTINMTLTDDLAGVCISGDCGSYNSSPTQVRIAPYNGSEFNGSQSETFISFSRTSGDDKNGTYTAIVNVPKGSAKGTWKIDNISLVDKLGNRTSLTESQLLSAVPGAIGTTLTNAASISDTSAPQVTAFSITPTSFNTESSDQTLTINMTLTDDLAGVCISGDCGSYNSSPTQVRIAPLVGTQSDDFYIFARTSGDDKNGTYTATITVPAHSKEGIWKIDYISLVDKLGNRTSLTAAQLLNNLPHAQGLTIANTANTNSITIEKDWIITANENSVTFPAETIVTKSDNGSFAFYQLTAQDYNIKELPSDNLGNNIVGKIQLGIPGLNFNFSQLVSFALNVGAQNNNKILKIKSLGENQTTWVNEKTCTVENGICNFTTNHATYFAAEENSSPSPLISAAQIYRFWSDEKQGHFYTASEDEKNQVIATYPENVWRYEGVAFNSYLDSSIAGTVPVYRFWSNQKQHHFYTASEDEKNHVIATYPEYVWKYEGVAYYAFPTQQANTTPIYRFWSDQKQGHFYTSSEDEKNHVIATYPENVWRYEGIAWYVPVN